MLTILLSVAVVAQSLFGNAPIDGIRCDAQEGAVMHVHADLQIFDRGRAVQVPAGVGIPIGAGCLYWLHTHATDGIIHIESPVRRRFTLGEFFDVWGPDLSWTQAASARAPHGRRLQITVNGRPWRGRNPRGIVLNEHTRVVIQSAPPNGRPVSPRWP